MKSLFTTIGLSVFSAHWCKTLVFCSIAITVISNTGLSQVVFSEDWESGIGNWFADNGIWQIGIPSFGPSVAYSGENVAATVLDNNYPPNASTHLISPVISLPSLSTDEKLQLSFWQWFSINSFYGDHGVVQISVNNGEWVDISNIFGGSGGEIWTQYIADLSAYADSTIRLAFYFYSGGGASVHVGPGWYIDELLIEKGIFSSWEYNPEDFEFGIGRWYADQGIWETGIPTFGSCNAFSEEKVAATVLDNNYPPNADSRLISPEIPINPVFGQQQLLRFWHCYNINTFYGDHGVVQISVNGGEWVEISTTFEGNSSGWTQYIADLSAYADSIVRIAFYFFSGGGASVHVGPGWSIDNVSIEGIVTGVNENKNVLPAGYELSQNYPNPFNPTTKIEYQIPNAGFVTLKVYNVLGNEIANLSEEKPAGSYEISWHAANLPSGVYFYRLQAGVFSETRKMILIK